MSAIISISLPTSSEINIYSAKIVKNYTLFIKILKESDITLKIQNEIVPIKNLLNLFITDSNSENITYFKELYATEFNSSKYKIFDIIEESYIEHYGFSIKENPTVQKHSELLQKINITEKSITDMWKKFDEESRVKITSIKAEIILEECNDLLNDPRKNENDIISKLEFVLREYKNMVEIQKESLKKSLIIKKNSYGQFVYEKYNFILDPKEKVIIGVAEGFGKINILTKKDKEMCEKLGLKCKSSINNSK